MFQAQRQRRPASRSCPAVDGLNHARVRGEEKKEGNREDIYDIEEIFHLEDMPDIDDIDIDNNIHVRNCKFINMKRVERELKYKQKKEAMLEQLDVIKKILKDSDCDGYEQFEKCLNDFINHSEKETDLLNRKLQYLADYCVFWYKDVLGMSMKVKEMCCEFSKILSKHISKLYGEENEDNEDNEDEMKSKDELYDSVRKWVVDKDHFHHVTASHDESAFGIDGIDWNYRFRVPDAITESKHIFQSPWLNIDCMGWWRCKWADCNMYNRVAKSTAYCDHCFKDNYWRDEEYEENDLDKWFWVL